MDKKFNFLYFWTTLVIFWIPLDIFLNNFWSPKLKNFGASKKLKKEFIKFKNFAIFSDFYDFQKCNFLHFLVFKNLPYLDHFFLTDFCTFSLGFLSFDFFKRAIFSKKIFTYFLTQIWKNFA